MPKPSDFTGLIGIDLGTTYSCVARLSREGVPQTIPNREGELITPSVLIIENDLVIVGREAKRSECVSPDRTAVCIKRDMGGTRYSRTLGGRQYRPEILSAMILKRIKADVETRFGPVTDAVITVPAYFDDTRRRATQDAGRIAGLSVLDIINEPTAAALAFAYETHRRRQEQNGNVFLSEPSQPEATVLVFDLGGGTFDVSIVRVSPERFETLATDGDVRLGGRDWDERLVEHLAEVFRKRFRSDPRDDPQSLAFLYQEAEHAKHALSTRSSTRVLISHAAARCSIDLTRDLFDRLTADLLARTQATTELIVARAGLSWPQIDRVLLVGGMTRVPHVREMLKRVTNRILDGSLSPDEAVAHGAALRGGILLARQAGGAPAAPGSAGHSSNNWAVFQAIDVNSHSLGIAVRTPDGYANSILIPKNTRLPAECARIYHTSSPNQRQVRLRVLEGEAKEADACVQIGEFILDKLPPDLPERSPIEVVCRYSSDGRISVQGRDVTSGRLAESTLIPQGRLDDAELTEEARKVEELQIV